MPLARLLIAIDEITKLGGIWRTLAIEICDGPETRGGKVTETLQAAGSRWVLGVLAAGRGSRLMWLRMLLLLFGAGQTEARVSRRVCAILAGIITIAALAPLIRLVAHKAPDGGGLEVRAISYVRENIAYQG